MARVVWTRPTLIQLDLIRAYIHQFDPAAAERIAQKLIDAGNKLCEFPNRGRPTTNGRRELAVVPPYVIRYRVEGETVIIQSIVHGAQLRD